MSKELKPANQHPDFGKVCIHGSLKRQCYTCELEVSNDWLKKVNQDLRDEIDRLKAENFCLGHESRQAEIDELEKKLKDREGKYFELLDIRRKENKS
jgi:hypothetical protein